MTDKLNVPNTALKPYCWILNHFLYSKKIPAIPHLLINGKWVSDFGTKANLFNDFFASIYTPINKENSLLLIGYKTIARITSICVTQNDISFIIKTLDPKETHGFDSISIKIT